MASTKCLVVDDHTVVTQGLDLLLGDIDDLELVGTVHTGNDTLTVITGTTCHVFIDGRLVRQLTLDPTRRVQPLHTRRLP